MSYVVNGAINSRFAIRLRFESKLRSRTIDTQRTNHTRQTQTRRRDASHLTASYHELRALTQDYFNQDITDTSDWDPKPTYSRLMATTISGLPTCDE